MHDSDCAVHNEPALPAGPCDCADALSPHGIAHALTGAILIIRDHGGAFDAREAADAVRVLELAQEALRVFRPLERDAVFLAHDEMMRSADMLEHLGHGEQAARLRRAAAPLVSPK